jgi:DNA-binding transcriptional MerR regulator
MDTFSQISMNFVEPTVPRQEIPVADQQDAPVNVGIRIKKLKHQENEEPAPVPAAVEKVDNKPLTPFAKSKPSGRGRKSIRQISEEADLIRIPEDEQLFSKQYYTMGEVSEMFRVNQSLLRFWEAEFSILQPKKNKKGDRYFRPVDIKNLHLIYHLLRQRKYTIEGAKDFLRKNKKAEEKFESIKKLEQVREFLLEMKASLR